MLQPYLITAILSALVFFVPSSSRQSPQWSTWPARLGHLCGLALMTAIAVLLAVCALKASPLAFALLQMAGALYLVHIASRGLVTAPKRRRSSSPRCFVPAVAKAFGSLSGAAVAGSVLPNTIPSENIIPSESAVWPLVVYAGLVHLAVNGCLMMITAPSTGYAFRALSAEKHRVLLCATLVLAALVIAVRDLFRLY